MCIITLMKLLLTYVVNSYGKLGIIDTPAAQDVFASTVYKIYKRIKNEDWYAAIMHSTVSTLSSKNMSIF